MRSGSHCARVDGTARGGSGRVTRAMTPLYRQRAAGDGKCEVGPSALESTSSRSDSETW